MAKGIKIKEVYVDHILFSDNSILVTAHEQDCCEHTYADFTQLEDLVKDYTFTPLYNLLCIEKCKGGFRFGDEKRMFFVPCYSMQNGAYSNKLEVFILSEGVKFYSCNVYCDTYDDSDGELIKRGEYYDN